MVEEGEEEEVREEDKEVEEKMDVDDEKDTLLEEQKKEIAYLKKQDAAKQEKLDRVEENMRRLAEAMEKMASKSSSSKKDDRSRSRSRKRTRGRSTRRRSHEGDRRPTILKSKAKAVKKKKDDDEKMRKDGEAMRRRKSEPMPKQPRTPPDPPKRRHKEDDSVKSIIPSAARNPHVQVMGRAALEATLWEETRQYGLAGVSNSTLNAMCKLARDMGNRDRVIWGCDPELHPSKQQTHGVRANITVRGAPRNTSIKHTDYMGDWMKTVYVKERDTPNAQFEIFQNTAKITENAPLPSHLFYDIIVLAKRDYIEHAAGSCAFTGLQDSAPTDKCSRWTSPDHCNPPTPPKPKRYRCKEESKPMGHNSKKVIMTDILDTPSKHSESTEVPSFSREQVEPTSPPSDSFCASPVAFMAVGDNMEDNQFDILIERHHAIDLCTPTNSPHEPSSSSGNTGDSGLNSMAIDPYEKTTMSRKHRKSVIDGINKLNHDITLLKSAIGLTSTDVKPSVCVLTSSASHFQDCKDIDVYEVGPGASFLEDGHIDNWQQQLDGHQLIVIAIEYYDHEDKLNHGHLLHEVEMYCEANTCKLLRIDVAYTSRWEDHVSAQTPFINEVGLAFTSNDDALAKAFESWSHNRTMDDVISWDFCQWLIEWSHEDAVEQSLTVAFPASAVDDDDDAHINMMDEVHDIPDVGTGHQDPVEDLIQEETLLDEVDVPGLPLDEQERRRQWKKLPQRVRIAVRRLHRQFGHVPKGVMVNLVRAAKVSKEFVNAVQLHRCVTCEETSKKKATHKTSLPSDYRFNHTLGIDVLEVTDMAGSKFQVLNMTDVGTSFQLVEIVREGPGQPGSRACLDALIKRWFSWAGYPVALTCDRGLHNRGVLAQFMREHSIQVERSWRQERSR